MSEEKSQEEKVRQNQVEMARSMKVKTGILEILEQTEDWIVREWIYICAMEGMNETQLKTLQTASVRKIQKSRKDFLQEKFSSALLSWDWKQAAGQYYKILFDKEW